MISGAHAIIYSKDADADRRFLGEVLKFPSVDAGHGWLIFALPPAEVAVHPADDNGSHELYLICDDIEELTRSLRAQGVVCSAPHEERWGVLTQLTLPGGGTLGIYAPRHPRPTQHVTAGPRAARGKAVRRKAVKGKAVTRKGPRRNAAAQRRPASQRSRRVSARRRSRAS